MRWLALLIGWGLSTAIYAETGPVGAPEPVTESALPSAPSTEYELTPQFSILLPGVFILSTDAYKVRYSDTATGYPFFSVGGSASLGRIVKGIQAFGEARLAYTYRASVYQVQANSGEMLIDEIKLHWLPLILTTRFEFDVLSMPFLKPCLTVGGGIQWLSQSGTRVNVGHQFWVPFYSFAPGLIFYTPGSREGEWSRSFAFSLTYRNSIDPVQEIKGWSFDLTLNFYL